jgi:Hint domain
MTYTKECAMILQNQIVTAKAGSVAGHGLGIGTQVLTLEGALPVEFLNPGDRIVTRMGSRKLASIEVSVVQNARVIRIAADTLGVDRPLEEICVSPDQPIMVRDWRAKAMAGSDTAMIAASRLVDGEYIRMETTSEARIYTLRFDEDVVIYAGGLELACSAAKIEA